MAPGGAPLALVAGSTCRPFLEAVVARRRWTKRRKPPLQRAGSAPDASGRCQAEGAGSTRRPLLEAAVARRRAGSRLG